SNRYNFRLRRPSVGNTGSALRAGETVSSALRTTQAPMRRGRAASLGPPDPVTAPAAKSASSAPADILESAPAESSLTDISEASFQMTSEETQMEIKSEVSTSGSETMDGYNINRKIPIPTSVQLSNVQERTMVPPEEATQRVTTEDNNQKRPGGLTTELANQGGGTNQDLGPGLVPLMEKSQEDRHVSFNNMLEAEPSTHIGKGKGPDPQEWGAAQLSEDELNPEIQQQILEACTIQRGAPTEIGEDGELPSELPSEGEDPQERSRAPTHEQLQERLRQQQKLKQDIRELQKALKIDEKMTKRNKCAGSEPIFDELRNMIGKVTQRAREIPRVH
ncbi:hypothetical protein C0989_007894, partial [Termitomyces sp. Mn162]